MVYSLFAVCGALAVFAAVCLVLLLRRRKQRTTTKCVVWACLINGFAWVWASYILAYLGRTEIAESLSTVALTEIVSVVLTYSIKSLLEKRPGFGAVGKESEKENDNG